MIDIEIIRNNPKKVKEAARNKGIEIDIDRILELDKNVSKYEKEIQKIRTRRNQIAEEIKIGPKPPEPKLVKEGRKIKEKLSEAEDKYRKLITKFDKLMAMTPQIPAEDTPVGPDESHNIVIRTHGDPPQFNFEPKDHIELGRSLNLLDLKRGVKVAGFRGYFLKNELVMMHLGLMVEALKRMQTEGYILYSTPTLIKGFNLFGSGHFPFGENDIYQVSNTENEKGEIEKEPLYLTGTAESGLGGYYSEEVFKEEDLPIKVCGFSPCYRKEIGTYGKDMKGIYRIHEFLKVEQFIICKSNYEISEKYHKELMKNSEVFLQELDLPYRVIQQCTGDMGAGKYKIYDIETYMPTQTSRDSYGETHSASNMGDWQARRYNIKYKDKKGEKHFVHTLNNTMIASPRILIAIMENNQQKDGSIKVPELLHTYVGKEYIKISEKED